MAELQSAVDGVESCLMVTIASLGLPSAHPRVWHRVEGKPYAFPVVVVGVSFGGEDEAFLGVALSKVTFCGTPE